MIDQYRIRMRTGRAVPTEEMEKLRNGRMRRKTVYAEEYQTAGGETLSPDEWRKRTTEAAKADGLLEELEAVKEYCRLHLAWLKNEKDVEEHALECLASGAYLCWKDLQLPGRMVFRFGSEEGSEEEYESRDD